MAELTRQELLKLVETTRVSDGNERVRRIVGRVVADLFRAIEDLDISPDEFWNGVGWLTRLGASGQTGLITAGLGFDRLLDIREDEKDRRAGLADGRPRARCQRRSLEGGDRRYLALQRAWSLLALRPVAKGV